MNENEKREHQKMEYALSHRSVVVGYFSDKKLVGRAIKALSEAGFIDAQIGVSGHQNLSEGSRPEHILSVQADGRYDLARGILERYGATEIGFIDEEKEEGAPTNPNVDAQNLLAQEISDREAQNR